MKERPESPLAELRGGVWSVPDAASEAERRERIGKRVQELQRELLQREQRRRRYGFACGALALLVSVLLALSFVVRREPKQWVAEAAPNAGGVRLVAGSASLKAGQGFEALEPGDVSLADNPILVTRAKEGAELTLQSETALSLGPSSEVGIAFERPKAGGFDERVRLRTGRVALAVPKLGKRETLAVETRDAIVEVRGTRFSVSVVERPPLESYTEVEVFEGRVLVRGGTSTAALVAGQSWRSIDAPPSEPAASPEPAPRPPSVHREPPERRAAPNSEAAAQKSSGAASEASDLAEQNRLLEAAELAQKSAMPKLALERVELLIQRFPDAELAHNARVERLRLLRDMGKATEAERAAREYLSRYPNGFARAEARRLLGSESAEPR